MSAVKNFLSNYLRTILALFLIFSILYYPVAVSYLDFFKEESALQDRRVLIISAQTTKHPNVEASLSDGSIEYFDFPSTYFGIRGWGPAFIGKANEKKLKELIGKNVSLQVSSTKYALFEPTLKIWAIHANGIDLSFKDISEAYRKFHFSIGNILFNVVGVLLSIFLMGIVIYADLRDRQSSCLKRDCSG